MRIKLPIIRKFGKSSLRMWLRNLGIEVFRVPRNDLELTGAYAHSQVIPQATLSPWLIDSEFLKVYENVKSRSLKDIYRLFELWSLMVQVRDLAGEICEVGVWRGGSGALIAARERQLGSVATVHLFDTFEGVVKTSNRDSMYVDGEHGDASRLDTEQFLQSLNLGGVEIHAGIFPEETGHVLKDRKVKFVHIDVDVYVSAKSAMNFLFDQLEVGGVVVFDDYGFRGCDGVTSYVDEIKMDSRLMFIHNLNGHAILTKVSI